MGQHPRPIRPADLIVRIERHGSGRWTIAGIPRRLVLMPNGHTTLKRAAWPMWTMLVILVLLGFELVIVGLAFQRHWLVLIVPGLVCGNEAWALWRRLTGKAAQDDSSHREL